MTDVPTYSIAVSRTGLSKPFGDDLIGEIGRSVCRLIDPSGPVPSGMRQKLIEDVSSRAYSFVSTVGEQKARLAFAEYGMTLRNDDEVAAT